MEVEMMLEVVVEVEMMLVLLLGFSEVSLLVLQSEPPV